MWAFCAGLLTPDSLIFAPARTADPVACLRGKVSKVSRLVISGSRARLNCSPNMTQGFMVAPTGRIWFAKCSSLTRVDNAGGIPDESVGHAVYGRADEIYQPADHGCTQAQCYFFAAPFF